MRRATSVAAVVLALSLLLTGCGKPKVTVRTGERVYCTYGELLTDNVRTIQVPADQAKKYSVTRKTILCDKHRRLGELYAVAQEALARGDVKTAEKALTPLVAQDPSFRRAKQQLDEIQSGKKPTADTSTPATATPTPASDEPAEDTPATGPSQGMAGYMPDVIAGFTSDPAVTEDFALTRQYYATDRSKFVGLVITAEQAQDKTQAASLVSRYKKQYPTGGKTVTVAGRSAYLGTDGRKVAGLVLRDDTIVVVMELAAAGNQPSKITGNLTTIAGNVLK